MPVSFEKISTIIDRSKKHECGHALIYHLMGKSVVDWHINTYRGRSRDDIESVLNSPYAQPAFVTYQASENSYDDGDVLGSLAGLAAEDDVAQFNMHLQYSLDWNDLQFVYSEIRRRMMVELSRPVFPCEVRLIMKKVYKKLAFVLRQNQFKKSINHLGILLELESASRRVADAETGWLEDRSGDSVSTIISRSISTEDLKQMAEVLQSICINRTIAAYKFARKKRRIK